MQLAVVRSRPNHILVQGTRRNRKQTRVVFRTRDIVGQPPALELLLFLWIVRGQIWTNNGPILPVVRALVQELGTEVQARLRRVRI